jgi:hypothetical protein
LLILRSFFLELFFLLLSCRLLLVTLLAASSAFPLLLYCRLLLLTARFAVLAIFLPWLIVGLSSSLSTFSLSASPSPFLPPSSRLLLP